MPDPEKYSNHIVETLLNHPQGEGVRTIARKITDIIFDVRKNHVFSGVFKGEGIDEAAKETLRLLLENFRIQASVLMNKNVTQPDDDLYNQIIFPLVTRQINGSA